MVDKIKGVSVVSAQGLRHFRNGLLPLERKLSIQHIMKRGMGTSSSASISLDVSEEDEDGSSAKSKQVKTAVETCVSSQLKLKKVSGFAEESVCMKSSTDSGGETACEKNEWYGSSVDGTSPWTSWLTASERTSTCSFSETAASGSVSLSDVNTNSTAVQASGSETVHESAWGHFHTRFQRTSPAQLSAGSLVSYPLGHLHRYATHASVLETIRYYHPTPHTSSAAPVQNRCHILYDDEVRVVSEDQQKTEMKQKQRNRLQVSEKNRTLISSPGSTLTVHAELDSNKETEDEEGFAMLEDSSSEASALDHKEKLKQRHCQLPRQWEYTPYGLRYQSQADSTKTRRRSSQNLEFSIMTYNILAQDLLENHDHLYTGSEPGSLTWPARCQRLLAELELHRPDILNMQEVQHNHFHADLQPHLKQMGYRGVYQKRSNSSDGCATLWKEDKFRMLRSTPVNYRRGEVLDRDNIALIVELLPLRLSRGGRKAEDDKLVVTNTHLLFNPKRGDVKLAQLMVLMAEIDKCAFIRPSKSTGVETEHSQLHPSPWLDRGQSKGVYSPVIMTGDFNLEPYSDLYNFIIKGHMDYDGLLVRSMSGQEEGRYGADRLLDRHFFSPTFGITDRCQYHLEVNSRVQRTRSGAGSVSSVARKSSQVDFTEESLEEEWECSPLAPLNINTGSLWHHLNLVSAYRHRIERLERRKPEVTTHHSRAACTVDYIFYTVDSKEIRKHRDEIRLKNIQDGRLRLLARYGLMSAEELTRMGGIPNHTLASDHVCLMAKFLLK